MWLQSSEFSKDVHINTYEAFYKLVLLMTQGFKHVFVTLLDAENIARVYVNTEKIRCKLGWSESAEHICKMMFDGNLVTHASSAFMVAAFHIADSLTKSSILPKVRQNIMVAVGKQHEAALFIQTKVNTWPICFVQFCVNTISPVVKTCRVNKICKGYM